MAFFLLGNAASKSVHGALLCHKELCEAVKCHQSASSSALSMTQNFCSKGNCLLDLLFFLSFSTGILDKLFMAGGKNYFNNYHFLVCLLLRCRQLCPCLILNLELLFCFKKSETGLEVLINLGISVFKTGIMHKNINLVRQENMS